MMKNLLFLIFLSLSGFVIAQAPNLINYQAAAIDNDGNVLSEQNIGVQVAILPGSSTGVPVYTEIHDVVTDANGVFSFQIGSGTTTDDFSTIAWGDNSHWLRVAIDVTGGSSYVLVGNSQLVSVPYALHAGSAGAISDENFVEAAFTTENGVTSNVPGNTATDDFVFGSTQLDDDPATFADTRRMFFDKSKGAFRVGQSGISDIYIWNENTLGNNSVALGDGVVASGEASFSAGQLTVANNTNAVALGRSTTASGLYAQATNYLSKASGTASVAMGYETSAEGFGATSLGWATTAESYGQVSMGIRNTLSFGDPNTIVPTDRLFVIGNGTTALNSESDALVILKNGNTEINGMLTLDFFNDNTGYSLPADRGNDTNVLISNGDGTTSWVPRTTIGNTIFTINNNIVSGGDFDDNFVFGSSQLDDNSSTSDDDNRFFFNKTKGAFRAGHAETTSWDNTNLGDDSFATGYDVLASGFTSFATGYQTEASAQYTSAFGFQTNATGATSTAFGVVTTASGARSFSTGFNTEASGESSASFGKNTVASNEATVAFGSNTSATGIFSAAFGSGTLVSGDNAFAAGVGGSATGFNSFSMGNGAAANGVNATAFGENTISEGNNQFTVGQYNTTTGVDGTTSGPTSRLFVIGNGLFASSRSDAFVVLRSGDATLAGTLTQNSDKRLKKNIKPLKNSLEKLGNLNGVSYQWKDIEKRGEAIQIGVIAQEIQKEYPELVQTDEQGILSVNYAGLTPILLEAIKELKAQLEKSRTELLSEKDKVSAMKEELDGINMKLEIIMSQLNLEETSSLEKDK
ncbi:tail fiber domain-containing protein [Sungkyunkwania multivorans]|uniref:Tail fiber domain-containing protein n=1 Tax=Sungkyunkwania multivorans TaxID=1173618 RepID=A0ABW3CWP4_9FLAO